MSVPLANDADPDDNSLDAQICNTNEGTDLKLQYIGFDPSNGAQIKYRVINVGQETTDPTTGKLETLSIPGKPRFEPDIPSLEPGDAYDITYLYGTPGCQNTLLEVRASVLSGRRSLPNQQRRLPAGVQRASNHPDGP